MTMEMMRNESMCVSNNICGCPKVILPNILFPVKSYVAVCVDRIRAEENF